MKLGALSPLLLLFAVGELANAQQFQGACNETILPFSRREIDGKINFQGQQLCGDDEAYLPLVFVAMFYSMWVASIIQDEYFLPISEYVASGMLDAEQSLYLVDVVDSLPELTTNLLSTIGSTSTGFGAVLGSIAFNFLVVPSIAILDQRLPVYVSRFAIAKEIFFSTLALALLGLFIFAFPRFNNNTGELLTWESGVLFALALPHMLSYFLNRNISGTLRRYFESEEQEQHWKEQNAENAAQRRRRVRATAFKDPSLEDMEGEDETGISMKDLLPVEDLKDSELASSWYGNDTGSFYGLTHSLHKALMRRYAFLDSESSMDGSFHSFIDNEDVMHFRPDGFIRKWNDEQSTCWNIFLGIIFFFAYTFSVIPLKFFQYTVPVPAKYKGSAWHGPLCFLAVSIIMFWSTLFTWLSLYCAETIGATLGVPEFVMGATFLAVGTSVPDIVNTIYLTRLGLGASAVASSFGSNALDLFIGLPLPFLLVSAYRGEPILVTGRFFEYTFAVLCGCIILFFISIVITEWSLEPRFAVFSILGYVVFVVMTALPIFA